MKMHRGQCAELLAKRGSQNRPMTFVRFSLEASQANSPSYLDSGLNRREQIRDTLRVIPEMFPIATKAFFTRGGSAAVLLRIPG
jgi:hypothetical protein